MKRKYVFSLSTILFLLIISVVITMGFFRQKFNSSKNNDATILNIDSLSINYDNNSSFNIDNIEEGVILEKKFSVTNMSDDAVYYLIDIDDISYDLEDDAKLYINIESTNNGFSSDNIDFPLETQKISDLIKIEANVTQSYTLKINYEGSASSDNYINGKINISLNNDSYKSFADVILANNELKETITIPGIEVANTNEGLIESEDDDGTTYYFRGAVENNYVKFANLTWRVIRINGDKSIRIILDDSLDQTSYNENELEEDRDDYFTLAEYRGSTSNEFLSEWYKNNIKDYASNIEKSKFCSDTNLIKEDYNSKYYSSYVRLIEEKTPSFKCSGELYETDIGIMSVDEAMFAGINTINGNSTIYLKRDNIAFDWWLGNPGSINIRTNLIKGFAFNANGGNLNNGIDITSTLGIRPVISLKDSVNVSGTGTEEDPYIIQ